MRTVDPALWSQKAKGRHIELSRPMQFGRPMGFEERLRASFRDAMREFWGNCSAQGVRRIASEDTGRWERYFWMALFSVTLLVGSLMMAQNMAKLLVEPPLHISLVSNQHSVRQLPFPAIALCSVNIISQRALNVFSKMIARLDANRTYSPAEIRRNLMQSGALLTLALPAVDLQFAHYLQSMDRSGKLNVSKLMLQLAPTCDSLLERCSWEGGERACSLLFATRITSVGYCCVFNGRYEDVDRHTPARILKRVGSDNGLSVILKEDRDDIAYLRKPSTGIEVLIFDGTEYPFLEGGAVRVQLARPNASVFIAVATSAQFTDPNIEYFSESWRGCRLSSRSSPTHWKRSYSWCLLECRRSAITQLCGCVPYNLQPRGDPVCTLNELSCLNKYREKFLSYYPFGYSLSHPDSEVLSEELQDALFCDRCVADCARTTYVTTSNYAEYQQRDLFKNKLTTGISLSNVSILRFFYASEDQHLYAVECNSEWFKTFALSSCQWVFLLGISLVTVFELIFHCTVRWRHHYVRRRRRLPSNFSA